MSAAAFRAAALEAASRFSGGQGLLRRQRVFDVLEVAQDDGWAPTEIAAQVLFQCCTEDGRFNNFMVGFQAVMIYLNRMEGALPGGGQQAWQDLVAILNSGDGLDAIRGWMQTHYS